MTIEQIRQLRFKKRVSLLDIAARTGLPENYLEKLEAEEIPATEGDLKRIKDAILHAAKDLEDDDGGEVKYG
ncbi:MAG: hypothetical protein COV74_03375 [Candidatus Omnitrophica bacterium CG11_big_fil_rev_8_21_14_0_20_45_26]|uniref:HTH cro/C1-type domain-containing protein n=1 Tax=Candidatus Abzuiibacterium crystallinum TaxID=1974748 RepID=A0A2H0LQV4_9BACT|nr:MAG: hypothetical protein COV74_03375 [Candidatus Omnitrophica bacterium CG11_big_fil_rev_8_21_14_0_20_45_26]PIW64243.1 MAG: hypothetical protein COW12_07005 [Candidatus Omnitrophica bacterium CG12_big_fil_rev_8_21_14_0_65_45_16]